MPRFVIRLIVVLQIVLAQCFCIALATAHSQPKTFDPRDAVIYIYDSKTDDSPYATGFALNIKTQKGGQSRGNIYLITNEHVTRDQKKLSLLFNPNRPGPQRWLELDLQKTKVISSDRPEVDLVAIPLAEAPYDSFVSLTLPAASKSNAKNARLIHEMEDVFSVSWVTCIKQSAAVKGEARTLRSIYRFGKVGMVTSDKWYSARKPGLFEQANVIFMQTNPGWTSSGSPLFLQKAIVKNRDGDPVVDTSQPYLVGVNKGYFSGSAPIFLRTFVAGEKKVVDTPTFVEIPDEQIASEPVENLQEFAAAIARSQEAQPD